MKATEIQHNNNGKTLEGWLREEVAPIYDAMKRDPSRAIPAKFL